MSRTLLVSCDETYFQDHGTAFVESANRVGETVWVNLVAPESAHDRLKTVYKGNYTLSCTDGPARVNKPEDRVIFAQSRFNSQLLGNIFVHYDEVLILDVDSFLRGPIAWDEFADCDYSLFLRDPIPGTVGWEHEGTRVAAGAVYFRNTSLAFIDILNIMLQQYGPSWFVDQVALWSVHNHFQDNNLPLRFTQMPQKYIDWEFKPDTIVWTGKGARKTSVPYLSERAKVAV